MATVVAAGWALGWDTGFDQLAQGNILISGFAYEIAEDITFTYMNTYGKAYGTRGVAGNESGGMPFFGDLLTDEQIRAVVEYERSL